MRESKTLSDCLGAPTIMARCTITWSVDDETRLAMTKVRLECGIVSMGLSTIDHGIHKGVMDIRFASNENGMFS